MHEINQAKGAINSLFFLVDMIYQLLIAWVVVCEQELIEWRWWQSKNEHLL